jgi:hypothetical protein
MPSPLFTSLPAMMQNLPFMRHGRTRGEDRRGVKMNGEIRKAVFVKNNNWLKLILFGVAGLVVINAVAQAKWCGPTCQVVLSDARGTLVQDIVTGVQYWI